MKIRKNHLIFGAGLLLLLLGIAGTAPWLYFHSTNHGSVGTKPFQSMLPNEPAVPVADAITGHPVSIAIPSLHINLPVIDGYYNQQSGEWTLTLNKAQFATVSTAPNNLSGDTFIYGHYRPEVFAYLHLIKPGSAAVITTDNGYKFTYTFANTYATQPTDTSVLTYQGPPRLTIQTCSGAWFQNRQMYLFTYDGYQKA